MGFRTEHYHVYEADTYFDISSKSEIERWLQIPREEWEQIVAWWTQDLLSRLDTLERERDEALQSLVLNLAAREHAEAVEARLRAAEEALREIKDAPSAYDVQTNALAKAMAVIALRALEGSWGEPYERAALAGVQAPAGELRGYGTNALIAELEERGDLSLAVKAYERLYGSPESAAPVQAPAGEDAP
jgi:BMFP domain-containing protein YqiC